MSVAVNTVSDCCNVNADSLYSKQYFNTPNSNPLNDWLVYEIAGVLIGGLISGLLSGRVRRFVD